MNCYTNRRLWPFEDEIDIAYGPIPRHYFCRSDGMFRYHNKIMKNGTRYSISPEKSKMAQHPTMVDHNSKISFKKDII
jgi:hypothetical protein